MRMIRTPGKTGMRLWLWDAGNHCGVTDDEGRAREVAADCISGADTARVELARLVTVTTAGFEPGYERSGVGDVGRRAGNRMVWTPLC